MFIIMPFFVRDILPMSRMLLVCFSLLFITNVQAFEPFQPLPEQPPIPRNNPQSDAKVALGRQLFFDPRLSFTGKVSCNSCHNLALGGEDGRSLSTGALGETGTRSTPTLWNVAYQTVYFWDGRAPSLEAAIGEHLLSPAEMGMPNKETVSGRLFAIEGYRSQFEKVFPGKHAVSYAHVTEALASYIRTLVTPDGPFDRYLRGDEKAISQAAVRGFKEYIETGCASCHFWVNFSGPVPGLAFKMGEGFYELFPNYVGTEYDERYQLLKDEGRILVTGVEGHRYMWRVPSLRNVADTAPYFHNGSVATLEEAVRLMAKTQLDKDLSVQQLTDIIAFLNTLTGEYPEVEAPELP